MKIFKLAAQKEQEEEERIAKEEQDRTEKEEWFEKRTKKHIALVQKYCKKIYEEDPERFSDIIERGEKHDQSKFEEPEKSPYLYISWKYKCKDEGKEFNVPKEMEDKMNEATEHHITDPRNSHHPEAHCGGKENLINPRDRDAVPDKIIDATKMPDEAIAEMCADFCGMSEEKGTSPFPWAEKNINKRWKFTETQVELIYYLLNTIWGKK